MYVDFEYYSTDEEGYGGKVITEENMFKRFERKSEVMLNKVTLNKLTFAYPKEPAIIAMVKDCVCEITELLYRVDCIKNTTAQSSGYLTQDDGSLKGKIIKSVSSGNESVTYAGYENTTQTSDIEAAKSSEALNKQVYDIARTYLSGVPDANGINLMYAGDYPGKKAIWD